MHIVVVEALLIAIYLGNELILTDIRKPFRSSACLMRLAGPCPAEPFQLVPAQLGLSSAGIYQPRACESPPKRGLFATVSWVSPEMGRSFDGHAIIRHFYPP